MLYQAVNLQIVAASVMNLTSAFFTPPNFLGGSTSDATKGLGYQYSFSADTAHYKFLSFPLSTQETIGVVLISLMNMLANAGGIGGGGIMIPFMMIFLKLPIEVCIPLANSFALISSITRFVINYNQPHPYRPWRKIIDYEVVTLTMPMVYLGTIQHNNIFIDNQLAQLMLGVQISAYMSQLLLVLLLQAVLIYTLYKTTQKGMQIWIKENQKKQGHLPLIQAEDRYIFQERKREIKRSRYTTSISRIRNAEPSEELKKITAAEGTHFTKSRILKIVSTFGVLFVCLFLIDRANEGKVSSSAVWNDVVKVLSFLFFVTFCILETLLSAKEIRQIHFIKRRDQYEFDENDIHFDKKYTAGFLISMCFLAGMLSGILGIAGGTIMSPLFLSLGMLPSVTAATNQYIGMVSSLSVTLQFMFKDKLNYGYLLFMGIFIFLSALLGLKQVNRLVKKTGRQSIIVLKKCIVFIINNIMFSKRKQAYMNWYFSYHQDFVSMSILIISFVLFTSFMILPFKQSTYQFKKTKHYLRSVGRLIKNEVEQERINYQFQTQKRKQKQQYVLVEKYFFYGMSGKINSYMSEVGRRKSTRKRRLGVSIIPKPQDCASVGARQVALISGSSRWGGPSAISYRGSREELSQEFSWLQRIGSGPTKATSSSASNSPRMPAPSGPSPLAAYFWSS